MRRIIHTYEAHSLSGSATNTDIAGESTVASVLPDSRYLRTWPSPQNPDDMYNMLLVARSFRSGVNNLSDHTPAEILETAFILVDYTEK